VIKDTSGAARCICLDEDYAKVFRAKYEVPKKKPEPTTL